MNNSEEQWTNKQWRQNKLAYVYHLLIADPSKHWAEVMSLFAEAVRKYQAFAIEIIEQLNLDDVHEELPQEQNEILHLFRQQIQAVNEGNLQAGFEMFNKLCGMVDLSPQANGYVLAYRGECYRLAEKWETALRDFDDALQYIPDDEWTFASRGVTYIQLERYQDALTDLDQALALDENNAWALTNRGVTYGQLERYQEALADFDRALALDKNDDWIWYCRAQVYLLTKQTNAFEYDIQTAIELAQTTLQNTLDYWRIGFNLALYNLVDRNLASAELQYDQLTSTCSLISKLQGAIEDLNDLLTIQPSNEPIQRIHIQLQKRIDELVQSPNHPL